MTTYERPELPEAIFLDDDGNAVAYGRRWEGSPPEDSYSRTSNLHRFAPLHTVAGALLAWLERDFDVAIERGATVIDDLLLLPDSYEDAVRIRPRESASASLTFVFTAFPGLYVHAGALQDFHFPVCGCDACDDDVLSLIEDLEWTVRRVVRGEFAERLDASGLLEYRLEGEGGMRSGSSQASDLPADRVSAARLLLPASGSWNSWPRCP